MDDVIAPEDVVNVLEVFQEEASDNEGSEPAALEDFAERILEDDYS